MPTIVYKVGGSLLGLPDLPRRLRRVLSTVDDRNPLLMVGGGPTADVVREWDRLHGLGDERAHWLALRSLMLNEALLVELMPQTRLVRSRTEAEAAWKAGRIPILSAYEFLIVEERAGGDDPRLPHNWDVTSDSIAAWIVLRWPADGLVLLKSTTLPEPAGHADDEQPVDLYFRRLAPRLPTIEWINLRAAEPTAERWMP